MDRLWSPERMAYITGGSSDECFLCEAATAPPSADSLVIFRTPYSLVMCNRYPYNSGHLLVAPLDHVADPTILSVAQTQDLWVAVNDAIVGLKAALDPEGFNVGMNLGIAGGAGVPGHLHVHIVPRWTGDTNFMPVVGGTKVLPEVPESTWLRLTEVMPQ